MNQLPEKPWYRIGEVARWLDVEPYVIRYWETEFGFWVRPERGRAKNEQSRQRIYSRRHLVMLATIRELLYVELYTIAGAKRQLRLANERRQAG